MNSHSIFSAFAVITPENQSKHKIYVEALKSDSGTCNIRMNAIGYPYLHAWLIITSKELSKEEQEFRKVIWSEVYPPESLIIKSKLNPENDRSSLLKKEELKDAFYEISISNKLGHSAYIYIDYPHLVFDGGYYYSIDLKKFCGN